MSRTGVLAVFAVALVVRLGVIAATPSYVPRHDDHDYDRLAWAMASGEGYPAVHIRGRSYAVAYRPPLWPALCWQSSFRDWSVKPFFATTSA